MDARRGCRQRWARWRDGEAQGLRDVRRRGPARDADPRRPRVRDREHDELPLPGVDRRSDLGRDEPDPTKRNRPHHGPQGVLTMPQAREAWIIDGVRTPRGKGNANGALHHVHPQELLAQCLNALTDRTGIEPTAVEDVIVGNGNSVGDHGECIGRLAVLAAGWPYTTPGFTLNRFCGSGQQAVTLAAMGILAGMQDLVVGGGVESMSRWPVDETGAPPTLDGDNPSLRAKYPTVPHGISADLIATVEG